MTSWGFIVSGVKRTPWRYAVTSYDSKAVSVLVDSERLVRVLCTYQLVVLGSVALPAVARLARRALAMGQLHDFSHTETRPW